MIVRMWRGVVRAADVEKYTRYIEETGIDDYKRTPGNQGAWIMSRVEGDRAEVVTLSFWESVKAIEAFAGEDIDKAVYYPEDDRYLLVKEPTVKHYEAE